MNEIPQQHLDYLAAKHAQALIHSAQTANFNPKDFENSITKTLGVLQENGVYACFLYLYAREGQNGSEIAGEILALFQSLRFRVPQNPSDKGKTLEAIKEQIVADLPTSLLAGHALEQMLIFARYGAKAWQKA